MSSKTEKDELKERKKRKISLKAEGRSSSPTIEPTKRLKADAKSKLKITYKDVIEHEEGMVKQRSPENDIKMNKEVCAEVKRMMDEIRTLKSADEPDQDEIERKRIHGTLQFVTLKKLNRLGHIRCKLAKDETNDAKRKIDQHHLQLQNLLYEVSHLQKEINKCLEFKSRDEDINLVSVNEFFKDAPQEISKPEVTQNDQHELTIARLDWEREQRKMLSEKLKVAQGSKKLIADEIKTKQGYLDSLQPKLNAILTATKPVQESLSMPFDETREQHRNARFLSAPLYVLYMQAAAYKEACDSNIAIQIQGDVDVARAMENAVEEVDDDTDSDNEEQEKQSKKHRRRRVQNREKEIKQKILKKHPLSVVLTVKCKDGSSVQLTFCFLMALGIISLSVKLSAGPETTFNSISGGDLMLPDVLLSCLYPDDLGKDTPNPSNNYALNRLGLEGFSSYIKEVGIPYQWAQWLAGLQFLNTAEGQPKVEASLSAGYMEETILRIRKRIKARQALNVQLAALERSSVAVSSEWQEVFPAKVSSRLNTWKRSCYEDFELLPYARRIINLNLAKESDMFFVGTAERGSVKMDFHVVVSPDYPESSPVFAVNIHWKSDRNNLNDEHVRDMEAEVNIHGQELMSSKSCEQLLTNQVQRLLMCFDVYLETEGSNTSIEGPIEFAKEKIFPRFARGPDRGRPFVFHAKLGFFSQR